MGEQMNIKEERNKQWGSSNNRGWDRWRITTFLEMIEAKAGRAIIAQRMNEYAANINEDQEKVIKSKQDLIDSLEDLINYTNQCLKIIREDTTDSFIRGETRDEVDKVQLIARNKDDNGKT